MDQLMVFIILASIFGIIDGLVRTRSNNRSFVFRQSSSRNLWTFLFPE